MLELAAACYHFWGSSFNDGTTQTALDPLGRGPVRTHCVLSSSCVFERHIGVLSSITDTSACSHHDACVRLTHRHAIIYHRHIGMLASRCLCSSDTSACYHHLVCLSDTSACYHHLVCSAFYLHLVCSSDTSAC
jgi:hypothetical protein